MTELVGIPFSPWSEKARWALETRRVPYTRVTYAPLFGELGMRRRTGNWSKPVSVPVLFDQGGRPVLGSLDIARWADANGEGETLFPKEHEKELLAYADLSDRALDAGRCLSLHRVLAHDDALRELVPSALRGPLGAIGPKVAAVGVRRTLRKYGANRLDVKAHEANLVAVLEELRAALAKAPASGAPATLLGRFTFADIAMTQALGFIEPPKFGLRIGAASRQAFTDVVLKERFADLIAWRDAIYEAHRPRS